MICLERWRSSLNRLVGLRSAGDGAPWCDGQRCLLGNDSTTMIWVGRIRRTGAVLAALGLLLAAGCVGPQKRVLGFSVEGRPIECQVFGRGDDVILIMATVHGDEPAGIALVRRLGDHLGRHPGLLTGRQVVLVPLVNPDGLTRGTRHNANGIDLNRNFPSGNFRASDRHGNRPLSEPESRAVKTALDDFQPDRMISIHQPYACIDYDGPAEGLARTMGRVSSLPVKRVGSLPGSLGSYAGVSRGIPIITLELPESAGQMDEEALWLAYSPMLLAAIRFPGPDG